MYDSITMQGQKQAIMQSIVNGNNDLNSIENDTCILRSTIRGRLSELKKKGFVIQEGLKISSTELGKQALQPKEAIINA